MPGKVNNVIALSQKPLGDKVFKYWFTFLRPLHDLTDREIDVLASFAKYRYEMMKVVKDEKLLGTLLMSNETKKKIREECGISLAHFQVIMSKLKKSKVIINDQLNPKLLPNIDEDSSSLNLLLLFPIK